jgi:hypothetical protein
MRVGIFRHFSPEKRGLLIFQFPKNLFKVLIKGIKKDKENLFKVLIKGIKKDKENLEDIERESRVFIFSDSTKYQ